MNYKLLVDTAILAGKIMLCSGAETYRVEDTITRILRISRLEKAEAFVTSTGIMVTLDDSKIDAISIIERVSSRVTNLNKIYVVNNISRKLCENKISLEDAYQELIFIKDKKTYSDRVVNICNVMTAIFFAVLLGGSMLDCMIATLNGFLYVFCIRLTEWTKLNSFMKNLMSSFLMAINTMMWLTILGATDKQEVIITSSIMALVPGVAITNAIRDTLQGDYMSGVAGLIEAVVSAASIAVGIGAGLSLYGFILGGVL